MSAAATTATRTYNLGSSMSVTTAAAIIRLARANGVTVRDTQAGLTVTAPPVAMVRFLEACGL